VTNVVLGLDGLGNAGLFADYLQWEAWRDERRRGAKQEAVAQETDVREPELTAASVPNGGAPRKKLSYMEQREYDGIEARIEEADVRLRAAQERVQSPEVVSDSKALMDALAEMERAKADHDAVYERWVELTEKIGG
jgi:ATP-binding cassette subfamily F protein uup